jgi:putative copper export protein
MLVLHILGATIWTGGHIVLSTAVLPGAMRTRSPEHLRVFEARYEGIGIPALILQVLTGLWLAYSRVPDASAWFGLATPAGRLITAKLALIAVTALLAVDARLRIIPRLSPQGLAALAWHILPITLAAIVFVILGVALRTA